MDTKTVYREFCAKETSIPIFSRDWWLDAVAGEDGWDVALVVKDSTVLASMPYVRQRRFGMTVLTQPPLTQKLGPWIRQTPGKISTRLAHEKEMMHSLIEQLPPFDHFSQNWHYAYTNWLPFSWSGFSQTTRYTYVLDDLVHTEQIWKMLECNIRNHCKKAVSRFGLDVRDDLPLSDFLYLNRATFQRQGMNVPYTDALVERIDKACAERSCRKCFIAVDRDGRRHAGLYVVWDDDTAYGLMAGAEPSLRNSGANSLCHWEAIKHASTLAQRFDFSGSMLEPVERFFRHFGATQIPYFNITKTPSRLLRLRRSMLSIMQSGSSVRRAGARPGGA
ncbi:MAG TPA: GNAT family N-acetyltransferase [Noviherbaspirillum sp.]|nr:GNAT family N-acetyltransferase [Noviherbaspirillum sp.]